MAETITIKKSTLTMVAIAALFLAVGVAFGFGLSGKLGTIPAGTAGSGTGSEGGSAPTGQVVVGVDDDSSIGSSSAKLTIIEFSDFQCPFCRRFWKETLPTINSTYIQTGKVKFVYRDFPLSFHPMAQKWAEAAECAKDQGKFWEMHDKIFGEQDKLGTGTITSFTLNDTKRWAGEIGLDTAKFDQCLDSNKYAQEVQKDFNDGNAAGVSGTPSFFIGNDQKGWTSVVGAQPTSVFQQILDQMLAQA